MKTKLIILLMWLLPAAALAQTIVNKNYPVKPGQVIALKFGYPTLRVSTWDKKEVGIVAKVNINDGDNDDAFKLLDQLKGDTLLISDLIKDMDKMPPHYTVKKDGQKIVFKTEAEFKAYKEKAGAVSSYSQGTDLDIKLEIKVPAGMQTVVKATYGIVELSNFNAPINIDATYGGIDATLNKSAVGQLQATTSFGKIYSNLDLVLTDKAQRAFFTSITAEPGKGPAYHFKSTYGKIYMRKP